MARQASLFGQSDEQKYSLFFAVFPSAEAAANLYRLAQELRLQHGLTGKVASSERLHVTLHWLGDFVGAIPEPVLAGARQAAATVSAPVFDLTFDKVRSFFGRSARPFVLGMREENAALSALHRELGAALAREGLGKPAREPFTPHVTLLYDKKPIASQPATPVRWTAHELFLVCSVIGKSEYQRLSAWPFRPREVS
jgi:RNA 2',3'-cyclic 3'-phosphodiesterase